MTAQRQVERVVQVHTHYRQAGGEDRAVEAERLLLESAGIAVEQVIFDNADLEETRALIGDLRLAASAVWSRAAAARVATALRSHRPQVLHVHNTFAAASPSVYSAADGLDVRVVQTLHNYRLVCPAATLFRNGRACTDCVGPPLPLPAVIHACVRGSRAQSVVAAATIGLHRMIGTYSNRVDAFIALTEFQRGILEAGGLPRDRIHVIPNFIEPDPGPGTGPRFGVLFVGRLAIEKGIEPLLAAAAAAPGILEIAGTGPMLSQVERAAEAGHLRYLGELSADQVANRMRRAAAVVVPSLWYEGFPMVVLEAFAAGTPVIASRIGSLAEVVEDGVDGLLVPPFDSGAIADALRWAVAQGPAASRLGAAARGRFDERYRGPGHLSGLLALYGAA